MTYLKNTSIMRYYESQRKQIDPYSKSTIIFILCNFIVEYQKKKQDLRKIFYANNNGGLILIRINLGITIKLKKKRWKKIGSEFKRKSKKKMN